MFLFGRDSALLLLLGWYIRILLDNLSKPYHEKFTSFSFLIISLQDLPFHLVHENVAL